MDGHGPPVNLQAWAEDGNREHDDSRQEVHRINFRQTIPDEPTVVARRDAVAEEVGIVVRQDKPAQHEEERDADVARVDEPGGPDEGLHPRDPPNMRQIDEERGIKSDSGEARQLPLPHGTLL